MDLRILRDKWTPADCICLINCRLKGNRLSIGLAWFQSQIQSDFLLIKDINGDRIDIVIPDEIKNQPDSIVRINTTLEVIK